jgi:TP901 family phage tail tape measure protein
MALPPILVELKANSASFVAGMKEAQHEVQKLGTQSSAHMQKFAAVGKAALFGIGTAAVGAGIASVKMAGDFQQSMTQLVTGAGESERQIKMVGSGILDLSTKVGYSAQELAKGMYLIESAGFHGANGLNVLKAAAEGARAGNAEMATVADALTTAMNAYHLPASRAIAITNQLIKTEQSGKLTMEQLASSLGSVVPAAATAHISLSEVLGAIATMTNQGTDAANATTYLRQTILQLSNPTAKARTEMQGLGLSAIDISSNLGKRGLTGTFEVLVDAIKKKMGSAGIVLIDQLQKASKHTSTFQKVLANLPPTQQTFVGALANMVGGTKSMQAALELTGRSAGNFTENVKGISAAAKGAGKDVTDWNLVQKNFNLQLHNLENTVGKLAIQVGTVLIPVIEKAASWFEKHTETAKILGIAIGSILVTAIGAFIVSLITATATIGATEIALAPITLAIAALGVGIYELAIHWRTIWTDMKNVAGSVADFVVRYVWHDGIEKAFHGIQAAARVAWAVLHPLFELIWNVGLLPIRIQVLLLEAAFKVAWDGIVLVARAAWVVLKPIFTVLVHDGLWVIKTEVNALRDVWDTAWGVVETTLQHAWSVIKPILDAIQHAVGDTLGALGKVTSFASHVGGGVVGGLKHLLPHFAAGTDYAPGGWAVAGELGPELVNLPRGAKVYPTGTGPAGRGDIHVHLEGNFYGVDSRKFATDIKNALLDLRRNSGQSLGFT